MLLLSVLPAVAAALPAPVKNVSLLEGLEKHIGLILLIASMVVIALLILIVFLLNSISEHLSWIRRIR